MKTKQMYAQRKVFASNFLIRDFMTNFFNVVIWKLKHEFNPAVPCWKY